MSKKQFVLIMTDTQRLDMVSCYQDVGIKTPNIDALAAEGVKFNKAYTVQPVCGPARSAIFTGQYPCINGSYTNCVAPGLNVRTIGQRLADKGVYTGYIGKWHLDGGDYFGLGTAPEGWDPDVWYDMRNYLEELTDEERYKSRQTSTMEKEDIPEEFTFAHRCASRAVDFIRSHADEDYFLVVSFDEPHGPSLCPQPYASMYRDYDMPKRPNVYDTLENKPVHQQVWSGPRRFQDREALRLNAWALFGCNSFVDYEIGRVVAAINEQADRPAVLYTTDHGDMLESHSMYAKGPAAYEEICHVPMILRGFGKGEIDTPVSHIDIAPTIWDFFGFENKPMMLQGESLLPLMEGERPSSRDVFIEFGRYETDHDGFGGFQPRQEDDMMHLARFSTAFIDGADLARHHEARRIAGGFAGQAVFVPEAGEPFLRLLQHFGQLGPPRRVRKIARAQQPDDLAPGPQVQMRRVTVAAGGAGILGMNMQIGNVHQKTSVVRMP
mgnify:CR=1 FL=1